MAQRGFTLIEMLTVITISTILVALAVPSFQSIIRSSRVSGGTNSLIAALDIARSEAIRRSTVVTVCRSTNADQPNANCSSGAANGYAGTDWAAGWIAFAKAPGNLVNATVEANDEIIVRQQRFQPMSPERLIIESTAPNPQSRSYDPRGLTLGGGAAVILFFDHRDTQVAVRSDKARCVELTISGRSRVARVVNDACPIA